MRGAREYAPLLKTGQYGRLFIVSSSHARGYEFNVWVLPEGEDVQPGRYPSSTAVKVYGPLGGQLGWTEWYGWLHSGPWQADFEAIVAERRAALASREAATVEAAAERAQKQASQQANVLASYQPAKATGAVTA